jgi:hypothetical protein
MPEFMDNPPETRDEKDADAETECGLRQTEALVHR